MAVPAKTDFFVWFIIMQILARVIGIEKKIRGNHSFFRDNQASIWEKMSYKCLVF